MKYMVFKNNQFVGLSDEVQDEHAVSKEYMYRQVDLPTFTPIKDTSSALSTKTTLLQRIKFLFTGKL